MCRPHYLMVPPWLRERVTAEHDPKLDHLHQSVRWTVLFTEAIRRVALNQALYSEAEVLAVTRETRRAQCRELGRDDPLEGAEGLDDGPPVIEQEQEESDEVVEATG